MQLTWIFETILAISLLANIAFAVMSVIVAWKFAHLCMWFHQTGRAQAQWELEKKALDARLVEAEAVKARAETERLRENRRAEGQIPGSRFGTSESVRREPVQNGN